MNFQERKQLILRLLTEKSSIDVAEFAKRLKVSEITVRRDLQVLSDKGLIFRTHGGAMHVRHAVESIAFENKAATRAKEKEHIARIASAYINDRDIIFMDCGSTVYALAPYVKSKNVRVITNSLPLAVTLSESIATVNLIGGELDKERKAIHGLMAVKHVESYKATKAFVGVDGISLKSGLSSTSEVEAQITRAMATNAEEVYLLCDSSKIETERYFRFAPLSLVHKLITDAGADAEIVKRYRKAGLEVLNRVEK